MRKLIHLVILFTSGYSASAQSDTLENFYIYNDQIPIDRVEREHIPLNGNEVDMIPFRVDSLFGFVENNASRKWLIKPTFEQVFAVYKEGAIVKKEYGYGLVNSKNEMVIPSFYENLIKENNIYHGLIAGVIDTAMPEMYNSYIYNQYFSKTGEFLFEENAHDQRSFIGDDTLAWFRFGTTYHIWSISGKLMRSFRYNEKMRFAGIADNLLIYFEPVGDSFMYYAFNIKEELVFKLPSEWGWLQGVYKLSNDLYGLIGQDADYFFSDGKGNLKPYGVYSGYVGFFNSDLEYFKQNHFIVKNGELEMLGMINRNGETLFEFKYKYIGELQDGLRFIRDKDEETLFIDQTGAKVIDALDKWYIAGSYKYLLQVLQQPIGFYDGLCLGVDFVKLSEKKSGDLIGKHSYEMHPDSTFFYYFDQTGKRQIELNSNMKFAGNFSEGLAPVVNAEGALGFINKKGEWAIKPEYELATAGSYPLPYLVVPQFIGGYAYIKSFKGYIDKDGKPMFSGKRLEDHYDFSH